MPRKYKPKEGARRRIPIDKENMKSAVYKVLAGNSIRSTARAHEIPIVTLKRYVMKTLNSTGEIEYAPNYRQSQVFCPKEEEEIIDKLKEASEILNGLTQKTIRQIAYQYACENNKSFPPNWAEYGSATYDWMYGFLNRHPDVSLCITKNTGVSRTAFDKQNVDHFFENLRNLLTHYKFGPEQIWNVDETGITTVCKTKQKVTRKCIKAVSKVSRVERGQTVTMCSAINASGNHLPPFFIFPHRNWRDHIADDEPPGTEGASNPCGRMTGPNFLLFLKFFIKHVKCSKSSPNLIIFDDDDSHISNECINIYNDYGIHILIVPPHTSQKLQPLNRSIFKTVRSYYNKSCKNWIISHPGRSLNVYVVASCLGKSYPNAMTPRNIQKSFFITGIYPFNPALVTDEFLSLYDTDIDISQVVSICADVSVSETNSHESHSIFGSLLTTNNDHELNLMNDASEENHNIEFTNTTKLLIPVTNSEESDSNGAEFVPSTSTLLKFPGMRPSPKTDPKIGTIKGNKNDITKILTYTPKKLTIAKEEKVKQQKKQKSIDKVKENAVKLAFNSLHNKKIVLPDDDQFYVLIVE